MQESRRLDRDPSSLIFYLDELEEGIFPTGQSSLGKRHANPALDDAARFIIDGLRSGRLGPVAPLTDEISRLQATIDRLRAVEETDRNHPAG